MELQLFQDFVDRIRPFAVLVDSIERVACPFNRQRWDLEGLAARRDGGDAGGYANADVVELGQLVHDGVDLLRTWPLQI